MVRLRQSIKEQQSKVKTEDGREAPLEYSFINKTMDREVNSHVLYEKGWKDE